MSQESSDRASPSILLPESRGSPNILEPDIFENQDSETYTEPDINEVMVNNDNVITDDSTSSTINSGAHYSGSNVDENTRDSANNEDINSNQVNEDSNPKRESGDEPPAKVRKLDSSKNDDTDGATCPICLDSWSNSGEHRLVALKCGHLFGYDCIKRWLKAQSPQERSCPTCKSKAALRDLRFIYAKHIIVADTTEVTELRNKVATLQAEMCRKDFELHKSKIAHQACRSQLEALRTTLQKSQTVKEKPVCVSWRFALEKNLEICKDGGCRVLTYNCRTYEFYVSQKSTNSLFPGYGIRKVSCVDYKLGQFIHLHPKPIRDLSYSQPRDLLLSVGLDSSARIVERGIPSMTVNSGFPLWSCSWDYLKTYEFYVGGVAGMIHQYDSRNLSTHMQTLQVPGDMSPVVSLHSTEFGLLSCHLNTCWLWAPHNMQWEARPLPADGALTCLSYDNESHRAVISVRPSTNGVDRSRLTVCKLRPSVPTGQVSIDVESTFSGSAHSTLMSRVNWVKASGSTWVAAHSETDSSLYLYGLDGERTMSLPASEHALDINSVQLNGNSLLAALSGSRLRLYKAVSTNF